jgi:hypothetical protein
MAEDHARLEKHLAMRQQYGERTGAPQAVQPDEPLLFHHASFGQTDYQLMEKPC